MTSPPREVWIVEFKDGAWDSSLLAEEVELLWPRIKNVYRMDLDWRLIKNDNR